MSGVIAEQQDQGLFTGYRVRIEIFAGPVDLLVYLVKREELDISEVAIAAVTRQYLEYLKTMQSINIEIAGEFIVTAATLLQIKARRLLPAPAIEDSEEEIDELELVGQIRRRMAQYRVYKEAALALNESRRLRQQIYVRSLQSDTEVSSGFVRLDDVSIFDIVGAVRELLKRAEAEPPTQIERPVVTVGERIEDTLFKLKAAGDQPLTFAELVGAPVTRQVIVVTFLAVLELIRRRRIRVRQDKPRAGIVIQLAAASDH